MRNAEALLVIKLNVIVGTQKTCTGFNGEKGDGDCQK